MFTKAVGFNGSSQENWPCRGCGATRVQLLAPASQEDECDREAGEHAGRRLDGGNGALNVFVCPADVRHALKLEVR